MSKEFLRRLPLFSQLKESDLDQLYESATRVSIPAGELLIEEGTQGDSMFVVLDGEFEVYRTVNGRPITISVRSEGEILGEAALLSRMPRNASVRARRDSEVLAISEAGFHQLLACSFSATLAILGTVTNRLRTMEGLVVQQDKLAALGTMAAGLAHELNNPAAAVRRSADQLRDSMDDWRDSSLELHNIDLSGEQLRQLVALQRRLAGPDGAVPQLDPLERSDLEEEIQGWLEDRLVDEAWELAPRLVGCGWTQEKLEQLAASFGDRQLPVILTWVASGATVYSLIEEIGISAERVSELVKSIKEYSFLDQAPIQNVDVHKGIENTLIMMRHKLKAGVVVVRDYAASLPEIEAYGSELNQVWTNLVDNAIDAMHGQGEIRIRTYAYEDEVVVEIADNGPGIPPEIQKRIFEPFFTTKGAGKGSGLGLHIVYNIVAERHRGQVSVVSEAGGTCFEVRLPIRLPQK